MSKRKVTQPISQENRTAEPDSEITRELKSLECLVEEVNNQFALLIGRLSLVMYQHPVSTAKCDQLTESCSSPLGSRIRNIYDTLTCHRTNIHDTLTLLALPELEKAVDRR